MITIAGLGSLSLSYLQVDFSDLNYQYISSFSNCFLLLQQAHPARGVRGEGGPNIGGWVRILLKFSFRGERILWGSKFNVTGHIPLSHPPSMASIAGHALLRRGLLLLYETEHPPHENPGYALICTEIEHNVKMVEINEGLGALVQFPV